MVTLAGPEVIAEDRGAEADVATDPEPTCRSSSACGEGTGTDVGPGEHARTGCCSDSEDDMPAPLPHAPRRAGAPRPLTHDGMLDLEKRGRASEQVSEMAIEYRAELGRRLSVRKPASASSDSTPRSDLEIMAEEYCAEFGVFPAPPQSPSASPVRRSYNKESRASSRRSASPCAGLASLGNATGPAPGHIGPDNTVIIFDWDDTLFPTWFLQEVVLPCLPSNAREAALPSDSPFHETLAAHASTVRAVLMVARALAQVAIVTLALRPWVLTSAERFLPGLDLPELLCRLGIPVYYAREHVKRPDACLAQVEEGVDIFTVAKRATMMKCLRKLYRKRKGLRMNVISIGDSLAEKDAIKEVLWAACEQPQHEGMLATPLCKTVKFVYQPSVQQLGDELQLLAMWLRRMASHSEDFDISMDDPEDLRLRGHGLFMSS
mmetsp:Transcript_63693/g.176639  ORF Transcript_63693/g.176639 Transcript_63693/m.176639 type:complete len:435 (-) Transcript_63693:190-1494(-)